MKLLHHLGTATLAAVLAACSSDPSSSGSDSFVGRGSDACHTWQSSICNWAERCGTLARAECVDDFSSVTCNSDDLARTCATELDSATCAAPPSGCDLSDLADRAPAMAACEQFITTACDRAVRCGQDQAACSAEARQSLDCSMAIGHAISFESCMEQLPGLACEAPTPDACKGAIKIG